MKITTSNPKRIAAGILFTCSALFLWPKADAQMPWGGPPITPDTQRAAMNSVRAQVNWLQNATRTAPNYGQNGAAMLDQQFGGLRGSFEEFKRVLTPAQQNAGANDLAELGAGLDIIAEAFNEYQNDIANGRPTSTALRNLSQVLARATDVWYQEFKKDCSRLRVGW
jgi:hypothetical protein